LAAPRRQPRNPAITLASAVTTRRLFAVGKFVAGAVWLGANVRRGADVTCTIAAHWRLTPDPAAKLAIFCTNGAVHNPPINFLNEVLGHRRCWWWWWAPSFRMECRRPGRRREWGQWLVACLIWGIGLSLGGTTGYAINPARDLGPRLAHWILPIPGKGGSNWRYAPIPVVGPLVGGALAGLLLRYAHL